jgi:hypothetical protein
MSMQLDSDTFQDVMFAPHKPLVVITAAPESRLSGTSDRVKTVAAQWKDRQGSDDVVFTWMDSDKWSKWLKSMYGITADDSAHVIISNHSVRTFCLPSLAVLLSITVELNLLRHRSLW